MKPENAWTYWQKPMPEYNSDPAVSKEFEQPENIETVVKQGLVTLIASFTK